MSERHGMIEEPKIKLKFKENPMKILEVAEITPSLTEQLIAVWEKSVKATHLFLSENEVEEIKKYIPQALNGVVHLIIAENESGSPAAFMGIEEQKLEMLFIAPEERGKGLGRKLLQYGMENYSVSELAVNEQNPLAKGFYEHMGFHVYRRTDHDEQGNPYPLLYMKL
jgi:putative acetyltransferase